MNEQELRAAIDAKFSDTYTIDTSDKRWEIRGAKIYGRYTTHRKILVITDENHVAWSYRSGEWIATY